MIRKIITIDKEKCNGCGLCATACHEGAIGIIDGKATLLREDYCDGLGDCLPACPTNAISFEEREALAYNEEAVKNAQREAARRSAPASRDAAASCDCAGLSSSLRQWPVQIKLIPVNAPYFDGADLLIAADCTAYAYGDFHQEFMRDRVTLIGCPKLDQVSYAEKLTRIFSGNNIRSITVARMEVPCCGGMEYAVKTAIENCGKEIPCQVAVISTKGDILTVKG